MHGLVAFLAIIASAAAAGGFEPGLRIRFGTDGVPGSTFFFDIPRYYTAAKQAEWNQTTGPTVVTGPLSQLVMMCYIDRVVCTYYDDTGYIAGVQVAIPKELYSENSFNLEQQGFTSWITTVRGKSKEFWTIQQYFVNEEFLNISKEERLASRDSSRTLQAGGVWLTGPGMKLLKVSNRLDDIVQEGLFTEQACIDFMGTHYYYNMSSATECTVDQMYPWFLATQNGELVVTSFVNFGKLALQDGERNWFERSGKLTVEVTVPNAPECVYDLSDEPSCLTMHIYYIDRPWKVTC